MALLATLIASGISGWALLPLVGFSSTAWTLGVRVGAAGFLECCDFASLDRLPL